MVGLIVDQCVVITVVRTVEWVYLKKGILEKQTKEPNIERTETVALTVELTVEHTVRRPSTVKLTVKKTSEQTCDRTVELTRNERLNKLEL